MQEITSINLNNGLKLNVFACTLFWYFVRCTKSEDFIKGIKIDVKQNDDNSGTSRETVKAIATKRHLYFIIFFLVTSLTSFKI